MQKLSREENAQNNGLVDPTRERSKPTANERNGNDKTSVAPFDDLLRNVNSAERALQQADSALRRIGQAINRASVSTTTGADGAGGGDKNAPCSSVAEAKKQAKITRIRLKNAYEILILKDFVFSAQHGIEEKLWRNVFYARIEELRSALRKSHSPENALRLRLELCEHIDMGSGFYHSLIDHIRKKSLRNAVDSTDEDASELTQQDDDNEADNLARIENSAGAEGAIEYSNFQARAQDTIHSAVANTLQRCLIALGDLARYQETLTLATVNDSNDSIGAAELKLEMARRYYEKGRRVQPENGKAHAQLAIIESLRGRDLDVVYWYMLSLATKNPSNVSRDNLRSFYSRYHYRSPPSPPRPEEKYRRNLSEETTSKRRARENTQVVDDDGETEDIEEAEETEEAEVLNAAIALDNFAVAALMLHRQLFFDQFQGQETNSSLTHNALRHLRVLVSSMTSDMVDAFGLVVVAVNKVLVIFALTIWFLQMRFRKAAARQSIRASQSWAAGFAFDICRVMSDALMSAFPNPSSPIPPSSFSSQAPSPTTVELSVPLPCATFLLSPVALWSDYCAGNSDLLGQLYSSVSEGGTTTPQEIPEETLQQKCQYFFKAIHVICTTLLHATSREAMRTALPEDVDLMGTIPFRKLQLETRNTRNGTSNSIGEYMCFGNDDGSVLFEERLRRVLCVGLTFAKMETFPFLKLGDTEGTFIAIDEEAKKRERERQMRAMAQQLLKQQVDALEHNLDRISMSSGTSLSRSSSSLSAEGSRNIRHIVLDMSILLDSVGIVRRITASGAFRVIVPLRVIDRLDVLKKGNESVNQRARDAIRYLDKTLGGSDVDPLRAQRSTEKLTSWSMAQKYLVRGRRASGSGRAQEEPSSDAHVDEASISSDVSKRSASDVPKPMRATISCCLWHLQNFARTGTDQTPAATTPSAMTSTALAQSRPQTSDPPIILATTDPALVGFARWFGIATWTRRELANALTDA